MKFAVKTLQYSYSAEQPSVDVLESKPVKRKIRLVITRLNRTFILFD